MGARLPRVDGGDGAQRVGPTPNRAAVREKHSYTTPAILVIPIESVDPDYHAWIVGETRSAT